MKCDKNHILKHCEINNGQSVDLSIVFASCNNFRFTSHRSRFKNRTKHVRFYLLFNFHLQFTNKGGGSLWLIRNWTINNEHWFKALDRWMQALRVCESQSIKLILIIHAINEGCYGPIVIFMAGKRSCTTAMTINSNGAIQKCCWYRCSMYVYKKEVGLSSAEC